LIVQEKFAFLLTKQTFQFLSFNLVLGLREIMTSRE